MTCSACQRQHNGGPENCLRGVVLVCGGRNYYDRSRVREVMDKVAARVVITAIRHGAATGADACVASWALRAGLPLEPFPADWDRFGRAAGPLRNQAMIDKGGVVCLIAFPGGSGTRDMVGRAKGAGLLVWEVQP